MHIDFTDFQEKVSVLFPDPTGYLDEEQIDEIEDESFLVDVLPELIADKVIALLESKTLRPLVERENGTDGIMTLLYEMMEGAVRAIQAIIEERLVSIPENESLTDVEDQECGVIDEEFLEANEEEFSESDEDSDDEYSETEETQTKLRQRYADILRTLLRDEEIYPHFHHNRRFLSYIYDDIVHDLVVKQYFPQSLE